MTNEPDLSSVLLALARTGAYTLMGLSATLTGIRFGSAASVCGVFNVLRSSCRRVPGDLVEWSSVSCWPAPVSRVLSWRKTPDPVPAGADSPDCRHPASQTPVQGPTSGRWSATKCVLSKPSSGWVSQVDPARLGPVGYAQLGHHGRSPAIPSGFAVQNRTRTL
jgi:hypothetical protein